MDLTAGGAILPAPPSARSKTRARRRRFTCGTWGTRTRAKPCSRARFPPGTSRRASGSTPTPQPSFVTNGAFEGVFLVVESEATASFGTTRHRCPRRIKQPIGAFTVSCFRVSSHKDVAGQGRCVTGTADGDLVVFDSGGGAPGGADRLERRGMRPGDRRAMKIIRVHHAAVTHLGTTGGARYGAGRPQLVSGGSEGNVRFFDQKLRLVAWFDGLEQGAVTSVAFVAQKGLHEKYRAPLTTWTRRTRSRFPARRCSWARLTLQTLWWARITRRFTRFLQRRLRRAGALEAVRTAEELVRGTYDAVVDVTPDRTVAVLPGRRGRRVDVGL